MQYDVNLGVHLVCDGFKGAFDVAAILTNDTDLVEPIRIVTKEIRLPVTLLTLRAPCNLPCQRSDGCPTHPTLSGSLPTAQPCFHSWSHGYEALSMLPTSTAPQDDLRFLHSFRGSLLDQLPETPNSRELYIASPYFGGSLEGVNLLAQKYSTAKLNIFPGVHEGRATDIPLSALSASYKRAQVTPLAIPSKRKSQFAHLKLYGVATSEEKAWLYCTSANCTQAAWIGPNVEAGLLRLVPRSLLSSYFAPADAELPHENISYVQTGDAQDVLKIWASDYSMRLEIVVAEDCANLLPLAEVRLTLRAASNLAVCEKTILFGEGRCAHVDWSVFPDWHRRRKMAICLEIEGKTTAGHFVRGRCFVENRLLLTADPVHRSEELWLCLRKKGRQSWRTSLRSSLSLGMFSTARWRVCQNPHWRGREMRPRNRRKKSLLL